MTTESKMHTPSKVKFQEEPSLSLPPTNHSNNSSLSGSDRMIPLNQLSPITQKQNEMPKKERTKHVPELSTNFESSMKYLSVHDKKVLSDVRPLSNSLKGSSSPLTSSWESFSSPKELSPRREEAVKVAKDRKLQSQSQEDPLKPAKFEPIIPQINDISEPTIHYNVLLKSLGIKQQKQVSCLYD